MAHSPTDAKGRRRLLARLANDGRGRFREIYDAVVAHHRDEFAHVETDYGALRRFDDEPGVTGRPVHLGTCRLPLRYGVVPGLLADCVSGRFTPFHFARQHLEAHGYPSEILQVGGRSSAAHNARMIAERLRAGPPDARWVLLGYSKGAVDILEALRRYPDVAHRTRAFVSIAGAVGGSPLVAMMNPLLRWAFERLPLPFCRPGDGQALLSLAQPRPACDWPLTLAGAHVRAFSVVALPEAARVSRILRPNWRRLARIDPNNDSQVLCRDAIVPNSELLCFANADHWAITLPLARTGSLWSRLIDKNAFPRAALLESIVRYVEEALLADEHGV